MDDKYRSAAQAVCRVLDGKAIAGEGWLYKMADAFAAAIEAGKLTLEEFQLLLSLPSEEK